MDDSIPVMVERSKKQRVVASAFDWCGWDRPRRTRSECSTPIDRGTPRWPRWLASPTSSMRLASSASSSGSRATA